MFIGILIILLLVLILPLSIKAIEKNLELFLLIMGLFTLWFSNTFNGTLFLKAATDPIKITLAVFFAGLLFKWFQAPLEKGFIHISRRMPFWLFVAFVVILLGLLSSIITAIISALVLVLIVSALRLDRQSEVRLVVLACFSIGLGAALTPTGEPLSTIAISKLNEDFFFLFELIGFKVMMALSLFGILAAFLVNGPRSENEPSFPVRTNVEGYEEILLRSLKIYFFVMGLTFLGAGFEPWINMYILDLEPWLLYWINMISAILDNATLAAAEISPEMDNFSISQVLLGLLISGGMLIPGNIPNIIAAGKLNITSKDWAKFGVPLGFFMMLVYFIFGILL